MASGCRVRVGGGCAYYCRCYSSILPTKDAKRAVEVAVEIPGILCAFLVRGRGGGKRPDIDPEWAKRWPMMICDL